jgi:hypothetical protein
MPLDTRLVIDNRDCLDSVVIEPLPIDLDIPRNGEFALRMKANSGYFAMKFEKQGDKVQLTIYPEGDAEVIVE